MSSKSFCIAFLLLCTSLLCNTTISQTPLAGLRDIDYRVTEGYTLFTPETNHNVFLINNCGEVVNEWEFTERPGATCYLLNNGNLLRAGKAGLEIRDWENNVLWSFSMSTLGVNQHHDIEPMPNGNILCLIADNYTPAEIIAKGRNSNKIGRRFKLDKLIELKPIGTDEAEVVWEWTFYDHLIQDIDPEKPNYGDVASHPELLDINFDNGHDEDFTHVNGIDYNPTLDQVMLSVRHLSEIMVIDHSTTTEEAKGSTGGNFNRGGNFLWRWGNPQTYKQGTAADQILFFPHDTKWVEEGYEDAGKVSVFNNDGDGNEVYSSIHLISPVIENNSYKLENNVFLPHDDDWSWEGVVLGERVYESKKSGTHVLPNGNFMMCETSKGQITEISRDGEVLWVYRNPSGTKIYEQNEEPTSNTIFRAEKYPPDFVGFIGKDMSPKHLIQESNSVSEKCSEYYYNLEIDTNTTIAFDEKLPLIANPVVNGVLHFIKSVRINTLNVFDSNGRAVFKKEAFVGDRLSLHLTPGIYIVKFVYEDRIRSRKILIL